MDQPITYVGLDVHKDTIAVALAEAGKRREVREHGKVANTPAALRTLAAKLAHGGTELRFCYEARPMPPHIARGNATRARVRSRVEHVFACQATRSFTN